MHSILPNSPKAPLPPEYALPVMLERGNIPSIVDQQSLRLVNKRWCDLTTKTIEFMETLPVGDVRGFLIIFRKQLDENSHREEITKLDALSQTLEERRDKQPLFGPRWHDTIIENILQISLSVLGKTPFRFAAFSVAPHTQTLVIRAPIFPPHLPCPQSEFTKIYSQIWNVATDFSGAPSETEPHNIEELETLAAMGHLRITRVAVQSFFVRHRENHPDLNTFTLEKRLIITISNQMRSKGDEQGARQILLNFNERVSEQQEYTRGAYIPWKLLDSFV